MSTVLDCVVPDTLVAHVPVDLSDAAIVARLRDYLTHALGSPVRVESFRRFVGGLSWITAAFVLRTDHEDALDGRAFVIKVGTPSGMMAPYSALPQARVLRALAESQVPISPLRWYSDDTAILGAPFLVTDHIAGSELNPFTRDYGVADASVLRPVGEDLAKVLAALHTIDWRARGVTTLQGEDPNVSPGLAQTTFWRDRVRGWSPHPLPLMEYAANWLIRHAPQTKRTVIVHGDYRVGNFLTANKRITAVLDWEMTHLGDAHEDLAWVMLPDMRLAGLIDHDDFIARYEAAGGAPVDAKTLDYYRIYSLYKMVAISVGGQSGFLSGGGDLRLICLTYNTPMFSARLVEALEAVA